MAQYSKKPVEFREFAGLRNNTTPERFGLPDLQTALNVDIDDANRITMRSGLIQRLPGNAHSLWCSGDEPCLLVQGTTLKRLRAAAAGAYELDSLRAGLTDRAPMSYWRVNDCVYYVNAFETGVIQHGLSRSFGLTQPMGQPGAFAIGGALPPGRYQYALTFLRDDGQESGTDIAAAIDLTGTAGIGFANIPVPNDPTVIGKAIYLTGTNGEVLYRALVIGAADTVASYRNAGYDLRIPLKTQFGMPAPAGHLVAYYRGHMLIAEGCWLWYSLPYRHELFMLDHSFVAMPADITMIAPVRDGVYVSADQTYFLGGESPERWSLTTVAGYPAIPGTLTYVEGASVGDGIAGRVAMWASTRGHCVGANGGSFKNVTDKRFSYPTATRGAGMFREVNGFHQYLAVLEGTGNND